MLKEPQLLDRIFNQHSLQALLNVIFDNWYNFIINLDSRYIILLDLIKIY